MTVSTKYDTFCYFNLVCLGGYGRRYAPNRKLFLFRVHVMIIKTARVIFFAKSTTTLFFVLPNPLLTCRLDTHIVFSITVLTDMLTIFTL